MADPSAPKENLGSVVGEIQSVKKRVATLESPSGTQRAQAVKQLREQVEALAAVQAALPIQQMGIDRTSPISATSSSFVTKASVTVVVPEGKTTASVMGIGAARITDTVTGGLTSSDARVVIDGAAGGSFPAAKDAAVTQVINVLNATHARVFTVTPGSTFTVSIQVSALNPSAFPSSPANFAQIAVVASFTN